MSNVEADELQSHLWQLAPTVAETYPDVEKIDFNTVRTNAHRWNRKDDFTYTPSDKAFFVLRCPMEKCIGEKSGIDFSDIIREMVAHHQKKRTAHLTCQGYGGYNESFHCNWFIDAEISITYHTDRETPEPWWK